LRHATAKVTQEVVDPIPRALPPAACQTGRDQYEKESNRLHPPALLVIRAGSLGRLWRRIIVVLPLDRIR
jgi:hypothetical protein